MKKITENLKDGIKVHFIETDAYKTDLVCIIITTPLKRETVTKTALIPFLLRRGTEKFPDQYLINKEMENMYGAEFNCGIDKMGDNIILKFYIESINNDYALNNEDILERNISDCLDLTFNPVLENGLFKKEFLDTEKETMRKVIESKIDNKDTYAYEECIAAMYGNEGFGLYKYGYSEDIDSISLEEISEYYNWLIQNSKIDIFISGKIDKEKIKNDLLENENIKKLRPRAENYILNNQFTESKQIVEKPKEVFQSMNVTQGKLVLGLDVNSKDENAPIVALVYNAILGGSANSFLFQNVREKASLAYTARSSFIKQKMNIFIRCGIQIENFDKAYDLIKVQLELLKNGEFTDEDLENAKVFLNSSIATIEEEQDTEVVYYIGQEISKTNLLPKEYIQKINNVSREDVINLANAVYLNTMYFLKN